MVFPIWWIMELTRKRCKPLAKSGTCAENRGTQPCRPALSHLGCCPGATEDEVVGGHHRLNGHEFEQAQGASEGQGSLACCGPWGAESTRLSDWTTAGSLVRNNGDPVTLQLPASREFCHLLASAQGLTCSFPPCVLKSGREVALWC